MKTFRVIFDDMHRIRLEDEDGMDLQDSGKLKEYIIQQLVTEKIGRKLMRDDSFAGEKDLVANINAIISYYYMEQEAFLDENHYRLLRLALCDTREDYEENN